MRFVGHKIGAIPVMWKIDPGMWEVGCGRAVLGGDGPSPCEWRLVGGRFEAACGPLNLGEAIHEFRLWADRR